MGIFFDYSFACPPPAPKRALRETGLNDTWRQLELNWRRYRYGGHSVRKDWICPCCQGIVTQIKSMLYNQHGSLPEDERIHTIFLSLNNYKEGCQSSYQRHPKCFIRNIVILPIIIYFFKTQTVKACSNFLQIKGVLLLP